MLANNRFKKKKKTTSVCVVNKKTAGIWVGFPHIPEFSYMMGMLHICQGLVMVLVAEFLILISQ